MTTTVEEVFTPDDWGATVEDVKSRLLHISFTETTPSYNEHIDDDDAVNPMTDTAIRGFIHDAAALVSIRIYKYNELPLYTQGVIRNMARGVVADGAAHLAQSALHPASSGPNDGSAYSTLLLKRFNDNLALLMSSMEVIVSEQVSKAPGSTSYSFPIPMFSDYEVY